MSIKFFLILYFSLKICKLSMKINATKNYVTFSHFQFLLIMVKTLVERDALESYLEIGNAMGLLKAFYPRPFFANIRERLRFSGLKQRKGGTKESRFLTDFLRVKSV